MEQPASLAKKLGEMNFLNECKWKFALKYLLLNAELCVSHFSAALIVRCHMEIDSCFHTEDTKEAEL